MPQIFKNREPDGPVSRVRQADVVVFYVPVIAWGACTVSGEGYLTSAWPAGWPRIDACLEEVRFKFSQPPDPKALVRNLVG